MTRRSRALGVILLGPIAAVLCACAPTIVVRDDVQPEDLSSVASSTADEDGSASPTESMSPDESGPVDCEAQIRAFAEAMQPSWSSVMEAQEEFPNGTPVLAAVVRFNLDFVDVYEGEPLDGACVDRQEFVDLADATLELAEAADSGYLLEDYIPAVDDALANAAS